MFYAYIVPILVSFIFSLETAVVSYIIMGDSKIYTPFMQVKVRL